MLARFWSAGTLFQYIILRLLIYAKENAYILIVVSGKVSQVVCKEVLEFDLKMGYYIVMVKSMGFGITVLGLNPVLSLTSSVDLESLFSSL